MNRSQCRQSAGVDARSERHQVVHCVRGEHLTSCFCRRDVLRFGGVDDWCQANGATRCATGPALRDIMSVHEAGRCHQEHHGVEQASGEIGASFWAGGRGGSRGRQSVPIGMPLNDAKSPRNQGVWPTPSGGGIFGISSHDCLGSLREEARRTAALAPPTLPSGEIAYAVLREHGRKRPPGVEPGAALMTAKPRGGPASNHGHAGRRSQNYPFPSDTGGAAR